MKNELDWTEYDSYDSALGYSWMDAEEEKMWGWEEVKVLYKQEIVSAWSFYQTIYICGRLKGNNVG